MILKDLITQYDTIIFDLGGVLIDLEYEATIRAFQELGTENFNELYSQALQTDLFDKYETGDLSSQHFINKLKTLLPSRCTPNEVVWAWNAMIKDFQPEKLQFLAKIKDTHTIGLLSNTNDIHVDCVKRRLKKVSDQPFESYFHHTFLSHELRMRKPHVETFLEVCSRVDIQPEKALFIDDSTQHIEGAQKAGLATFHFPQNVSFASLDLI